MGDPRDSGRVFSCSKSHVLGAAIEKVKKITIETAKKMTHDERKPSPLPNTHTHKAAAGACASIPYLGVSEMKFEATRYRTAFLSPLVLYSFRASVTTSSARFRSSLQYLRSQQETCDDGQTQ